MFDKLRYTSSSLFAVIITLVTFVGMSMLIAPASYKKTTELEIGDFTSVRDMKAPNVTKQPKKKIPPKQEQVKQPPAAPQLDVTKSFDRNDIKLTQGMSKADIKNLDNIMVPILNPKDDDFELGQELTNTLSVQPMYPHKQMINKMIIQLIIQMVIQMILKIAIEMIIINDNTNDEK